MKTIETMTRQKDQYSHKSMGENRIGIAILESCNFHKSMKHNLFCKGESRFGDH